MRLSRIRNILFLLLGCLAVATISIAVAVEEKDAFTVKNFRVSDLPADDGSGLVLSWTPLPKERRIIEYRVYRGVDPDQLFFLSSIAVNVKTGVASDSMFFYDSSADEFIDIKSPARLKKEKQQGPDSPIHRNPPRDIKVLAKLAKHFNLQAMMEKNQFYYRTKKSFSANQEDSTVYAGLPIHQVTIRAGLKADSTYYYSVVAVDERNIYHPHAAVQPGIPRENPPEPARELNAVYLQDKQTLQFEWEYPLYKDDLVQYQILMLPQVPPAEWEARKGLPGLGGLPAMPVAMGPAGYSNYAKKDVKELLAQGITAQQISNSSFCLALVDGSGLMSYSHLVSPKLTDSTQLPPKPVFRVIDKPNDKGDRLAIIWSSPVVLITKVSFTNEKNEKMKINYLINANETQKVRSIYFDFYKKGEAKPFKTVNEFYPDNIIKLKVPSGYDIKQGMKVVMRLKGKPEIEETYKLNQSLDWSDQILSLNPGNLYNNGHNLNTLQNVVYQKPPSMTLFYQAKKMTSYDSNMEITIPYETNLFKMVLGVNLISGDSLITYGDSVEYSRKLKQGEPKANLVLMDSSIDLMVDPKTEKAVRTSIYSTEGKPDQEKKQAEYSDQLKQLQAQEAALTAQIKSDPAVTASLERLTKQKEGIQKSLESLKLAQLTEANQIDSDDARMRFIARTREQDKRRATFYMVRTDGKGMFVESDSLKDNKGKLVYETPVANWFDRNKLTALFASLVFGVMVFFFVRKARRGHDLYIRPIGGIQEIDNAIGRATEMGRPILYVMGSGHLSDIPIIASLGILSQVAKKAAEYDTRLIVPCYDYIVMPVAQEVVRDAHYEAGRPDSYDKNNVFYLTQVQFAYVAGVNGIMIREKVATNFFLGYFAAEALLMTETGNAIGAIQIAGSDAVTQIPFFITTCDYTLIGEELYAASAYLNREPMLLGTLKAQDYYKFLILTFIIIGAALSSLQLTSYIEIFPVK